MTYIPFLDVNECDRGISGCAHECNNTEGNFTCYCNEGYELSSRTACSNIDECAGSNDCHQNASCTDAPGSYICTCDSGLFGNGTHCNGEQ